MPASIIRDALLTSICSTFQTAKIELNKESLEALDARHQIRRDISNWGGGLVEVKTHDGINMPQVMHQTVVDFTMSLEFKSIVLGSLASIVSENIHCFYMKYYATQDPVFILEGTGPPVRLDHSKPAQGTVLNLFAYHHADMSEHTTGRSHLEFLIAMPLVSASNSSLYIPTLGDCGQRMLEFESPAA